jgi:hypothetical protein
VIAGAICASKLIDEVCAHHAQRELNAFQPGAV